MTAPLATLPPDQPYDLCIVGGGIQGAGIARDAAMRGLRVILAEKNDFGSATSSQSSKLIHGGLRYLERAELSLVYESLKERATLLRIAPQLVQPLTLQIPIYKESRRSAWLYKLALLAYDILAYWHPLRKHQFLPKNEIPHQHTLLRMNELRHLAQYTDCQMQDARLVIANIQDATRHGAHCFNYTAVVAIEKSRSGLFQVTFEHGGQKQLISTQVLANVAGPWVDEVTTLQIPDHQPLLTQAKGVHLLLRLKKKYDQAYLLEAPDDQRLFFALPYGNDLLVGTTDTAYQGGLDKISADLDDVRYLWRNLCHYFTPESLQGAQLIGTFAGVRPLTYQAGRRTRDISRDYRIREMTANYFCLVGGKYTVYRKIAEKLVNQFCQRLPQLGHKTPCRTADIALPGSECDDWQQFCQNELRKLTQEHNLSAMTARQWLETYGTEIPQLLKLLKHHPELQHPLSSERGHLAVEVLYGIRYEYVKTLEDFLMRRTSLHYTASGAVEALPVIIPLMKKELGLSSATLAAQEEAYWQRLSQRKQLAEVLK